MDSVPSISQAVAVVVAYRASDGDLDRVLAELRREYGAETERYLIEALCSLVGVTAGVLARRDQTTCEEVLTSIGHLAAALDANGL
jgi:hypothetical protein